MDERTKKRLRYPAELKKKALLELAESGEAGAVARHYNVSKQTLYNWKSNLNRRNKKPESHQGGRHFQELLKVKRENAKLKQRVKLLRNIVKKTS